MSFSSLLFSQIKFYLFVCLLFFSSHWSNFFVATYLLKAERTNPLFRDCLFCPSRNLEFVTFIQLCGPDSRKPGSPYTSQVQTSLSRFSCCKYQRTGNRGKWERGQKDCNVSSPTMLSELLMSEELLQSHRFHINVYPHRVVW